MAGRYPYNMRLAHIVISNGFPIGLPLNQTTIANELKRGGYATHCVGKWDLGMHKWEYTLTYRGFGIAFMVIMHVKPHYHIHGLRVGELTTNFPPGSVDLSLYIYLPMYNLLFHFYQ